MPDINGEGVSVNAIGKRVRVMVVDDEPLIREVVVDTIRFAGHEVVAVAVDGAEAVERAAELRPDLVIMDVVMPRLSGVEAMEAMLEAGTARSVALMSGEFRSLGLNRAELLQRGAVALLEKPFSVTEVFELLERASQGKLS